MNFADLVEKLGRPALWITRMRKSFGLPCLEEYPDCYEVFLRKIRDLRNLGISEEKLGDLWSLERKLIENLHLDLGDGELSLIEGCSIEVDPDRRLLLSNADLGMPLMARDIQAGLNFKLHPRDLFNSGEMGEDALRLVGEYRDLLQRIGVSVTSESRVLKNSLKWARYMAFPSRQM
jgi:hypothetical protein